MSRPWLLPKEIPDHSFKGLNVNRLVQYAAVGRGVRRQRLGQSQRLRQDLFAVCNPLRNPPQMVLATQFGQDGRCLIGLGCRGPATKARCDKSWNGIPGQGTWCIGANAPCHGCAEPAFYKDLSPLYEPLPNVHLAGVTSPVETLGWIAAGATAVGIGGHYLYKQLGKKAPEGGEE